MEKNSTALRLIEKYVQKMKKIYIYYIFIMCYIFINQFIFSLHEFCLRLMEVSLFLYSAFGSNEAITNIIHRWTRKKEGKNDQHDRNFNFNFIFLDPKPIWTDTTELTINYHKPWIKYFRFKRGIAILWHVLQQCVSQAVTGSPWGPHKSDAS